MREAASHVLRPDAPSAKMHPMAKTVFIDADACPVKAEAVDAAARRGFRAILVANGGVRPSAFPAAEIHIAPEGPDEADKWIAEQIGPGDICVTSDIPLAARCLEAGAQALRPNGDAFKAASIGRELAMRDLKADLRAANPLARASGPPPFSKADRGRFLDALNRMIDAASRDRR